MNPIEQETSRKRERVLLVDDQISVREMVVMLLDREGFFVVTAEATSGLDGLRLFRKYRPALVISALALPEMNGPELITAIREEERGARILVYSGSRSRELILAALDAGPQGFVHKTEPLQTLREAIVAVAKGITFFGPYATRIVGDSKASERSTKGLPPKLRTVLQLIAEGNSTKQIADRMILSPKTVEHYRLQVMERLGLRNVASLTRYAVRSGVVAAE